jgi:hypothetical protein
MNCVRFLSSICAPAALLLWSGTASANMSYSPWVHELIQNGPDIVVTVAVFNETEAVNPDGEPLPGLDSAYTLERWDEAGSEIVFENRVFDPAEADATSGYACHTWDGPEAGPCDGSYECADCDDDGVDECDGFCGVAYYYTVVDECPAPGSYGLYYWMRTDPPYDLYAEGEGLGFTTGGAEDVGAACQHPDGGGCSASLFGARPAAGLFLLLAAAIGY